MEAINLLDVLRGDNITTDAASAMQENRMVLQEGINCDCWDCQCPEDGG